MCRSRIVACLRALQREHRVVGCGVAHADLEAVGVRREPFVVALVVGGVRDGQEALAEAVGEEVVEHPAVLAAEHRVLRSAVRRAGSTSFESSRCRNASASGPLVSICPMWETSNRPACRRTARCSCRIPSYWTGISQPGERHDSRPGRRRGARRAAFGAASPKRWPSRGQYQRSLRARCRYGAPCPRRATGLLNPSGTTGCRSRRPESRATSAAGRPSPGSAASRAGGGAARSARRSAPARRACRSRWRSR